MFQSLKDAVKEFLSLEKQYFVLILLFILSEARIDSGETFEIVLMPINKVVTALIPDKLNSSMHLFDVEYIHAFSKILVYVSTVSLIAFAVILLIQLLVCEKLLKLHVSMNGIQYAVDTFIGKLAVSSINAYLFIYLFNKAFGISSNLKIYMPDNDFTRIGFWFSLIISAFILSGLFIHGIPKKHNRAETN
ncbi:MAG: hypothetical protein ACOZCL_18050 [Bacillota bacterium]